MKNKFLILLLAVFFGGCSYDYQVVNLVPNEIGSAPNYWCTWYWQNYLILGGQEAIDC